MVQYWVKVDRIHIYPDPPCRAERKDEKLYDSLENVPSGNEKCDICFKLPR